MDYELIIIFSGAIASLAVIPLTILGGMTIARANLKLRLADKHKMLETYRLLMQEKLETVKTALAVGFTLEDLKILDERLEQLIGADEMRALIDPKEPRVPLVPTRLVDADLSSEIERLHQVIAARSKLPDAGDA